MQEPGQILVGVTSPGGIGDALQSSWKDGTLAEYVLLPAQIVTPIEGLDHYDLPQLTVITRCIVPFGGLTRGRLQAGETVVVNGASGAYGSAATLVALAMGASRVVAAGRSKESLETLANAGGDRVVPVVLTGDAVKDTKALRSAANGGVLILPSIKLATPRIRTRRWLRSARSTAGAASFSWAAALCPFLSTISR